MATRRSEAKILMGRGVGVGVGVDKKIYAACWDLANSKRGLGIGDRAVLHGSL